MKSIARVKAGRGREKERREVLNASGRESWKSRRREGARARERERESDVRESEQGSESERDSEKERESSHPPTMGSAMSSGSDALPRTWCWIPPKQDESQTGTLSLSPTLSLPPFLPPSLPPLPRGGGGCAFTGHHW
jgi:hypothetical protein